MDYQIIRTLEGRYVGFIDTRGGLTFVLDGDSGALQSAQDRDKFFVSKRGAVLDEDRKEGGALVKSGQLRIEMKEWVCYDNYRDYAETQKRFGTLPLKSPKIS